ncbi:FHA domain-containing protein [Deltaproteobacteria bacterium PRO3]|nr:FHA domain-containing protein [Deltaproteobacteria bacterium PRO3]
MLRKNKDFFEQISALHAEGPEQIPLNIQGKDPEARTEAKIQANGDVEVTFVYPLDDNSEAGDGRIYLRDTFLFDSAEQRLKSFQRSAEYNGKGQGQWQAWLEKYKAALAAAPLKAEDEKVQKFAQAVGRSFGRPVTDEDGATLPEIREVLAKDPSYIKAANALYQNLREQNPQLPEFVLKVKDKRNFITILPGEENFEVVFNFAFDSDADPANGRILFKERFLLDPKTLAFKEVKRSWELAPEAGENAELAAAVESLKQAAPPTSEEAGKFIQGMLPVLLSGADRDAANGLPKLIAPMSLPKDYRSPLAKRLADETQGLSATPAGVVEALEAMAAVSHSSLSRRHDASLGWWDRRVRGKAPVDAAREEGAIQSLFQKAAEHLKATPSRSALEVLQTLKLEGTEAALRDRLVADPRIAKLDAIGREGDEALRAREFLAFARADLSDQFEYAGAAVAIAQRLRGVEGVKAGAEQILAVAEGKGPLGAKMEILTPRFVKHVADWKMLVAMGAAPIAGTLFEAGSLRLMATAGKLRSVGKAGRFAASVGGLGFEAGAFTAVHRGLESAVHDPAKAWAHAPQEILGAALLFGAMRFGHGISGRITRQMADGKWGTLFGGKTAGEGMGFVTSPTGRILEDQLMTGSLTPWGTRLSSLVNHGSGVTAMYAAGAMGRKLGIHPDDKRNLGEHWFEAALMYTQAAAGFSLANKLTGGRLQATLAELKVRTANLAQGNAEAPAAEKPKRDKPITLKPKGSGVQRFELKFPGGSWAVDVKTLNRVWIGRTPSAPEGVSYPDAGLALVNVGEKFSDINQYHTMLLRDESGIFWFVADTGSVYGTYVNGKRLEAGEFVLAKPNALIELGDHFKFRLEADGNLLEPAPGVTTIVRPPVPASQRPVEAPKPADVFPMDVLFPDAVVKAESNAEVGVLKSSRGQNLLLRSGKSIYNFKAKDEPLVRLYVDAKGRWVLQKLDPTARVEVARPGTAGEKRWVLERLTKDSEGSQPGRGRQDWVFLRNGDQLYLRDQIFDFILHSKPKVEPAPPPGPRKLPRPRPGGIEVPIHKAGQALDPNTPADEMPTGIMRRKEVMPPFPQQGAREAPPARDPMSTSAATEAEYDSEGDRPTVEVAQARVRRVGEPDFDSEPTRPGIPMPIDMPDQFPGMLLGKIPANEPPFLLIAGARGFNADLKHTRYVLGSDPKTGEKSQVGVQVEGHRIDPSHAEIYLGRKSGEEDYQWFLSPHPDSESGVFIDGYRQLRPDERVPLTPGRVFSLGHMTGENGGIQFTFDIPWLKRPGSFSEGVKPASVFPKELLSHLDPDMPPMGLRSNFGSYVLRGNRETTRYILGSGSSKPANATTAFHQVSGEKIDAEHAEIFIDAEGQWYLRALSETHPTYFKGKRIEPGTVHLLRSGDPIELGGDSKDGVGLAVLFYKPDYTKPERDSAKPGSTEDADAEYEPVSASDLMSPAGLPSDPVHELRQDDIKTVVPPKRPPPPRPPQRVRPAMPPPLPDAPVPEVPPMTPPPLPGTPPVEGKGDVELKTGVFPVRPDLLARSALGDVEDPPPTVQRPESPRASRPPSVPPAAPADPKPESKPPADPPAADDNPMAGWGEEFVREGIVDAPSGHEAPPASPKASSAGGAEGDGIQTINAWENPPRVVPVAPKAAEAYPGANFTETASTEFLQALHPALRSSSILHWVEPLLKNDRSELRAVLEPVRAFPQLVASPSKRLVGSTKSATELFDFFQGLVEGSGESSYSKDVVDRAFELLEVFRPQMRQGFRLESDGINLSFSAFEAGKDAGPNTVLSLAVKPGSEAQTLEAVMQHFLTLDIPVEVVTPLNTAGMKTPYVGVFFRADQAAKVFQAAEALSESHAGILDFHLMPFSHPALNSRGEKLQGMGVMEHVADGGKANLQEVRVYAIARAYNAANRYTKNLSGEFVPDPQYYLKQALLSLEHEGFDLNQPGFRQGSVETTHFEAARRSVSNIFFRP